MWFFWFSIGLIAGIVLGVLAGLALGAIGQAWADDRETVAEDDLTEEERRNLILRN